MYRLAITLIKKFGFQQARKMAPQFGVDGQAWRTAESMMRISEKGMRRTYSLDRGIPGQRARFHMSGDLDRAVRQPPPYARLRGNLGFGGPGNIRGGLERIGRHTAPTPRPDPYGQRLKNIDVIIERLKAFQGRRYQ